MICLNTGDYIAGIASAASEVTCTISGFTIDSVGAQAYDVLYQGQLAAAAAAIYTVPSAQQANILSIHIVNMGTVARTFRLYINGLVAASAILPTITLRPGGHAICTELGGWQFLSDGIPAFNGVPGVLVGCKQYVSGDTQYSPSAGVRLIYVEAVGGGGGGGGVLDAVTNSAGGGGGGAGAYSAVLTTTIANYALAIGAGGAGGAAGANNGTAGGDTTFGSILTAKGGSGGISDTVAAPPKAGGLGGAGGLASSGVGDILANGGPGGAGSTYTAALAVSGDGGNSHFGTGALGRKTQGDGAAANTFSFGGGGAGGCNLSSAASQAGGAGAAGMIRVWEFS